VGDEVAESSDEACRVSASIDDGRVRVVVEGEFDLASGAHWDRVVTPLADEAGRSFEVDLGNVRFMDSSGLGQLVRLHQMLVAAGTERLRLCNVPANVRRVLDTAGVINLFDVSAVELEPDGLAPVADVDPPVRGALGDEVETPPAEV
jgi:anti-anti-sigma factor